MYILPLHCATVIPDDEAEAVDGTEPASEVESDVGDHDPPLIPLTDAGLGSEAGREGSAHSGCFRYFRSNNLSAKNVRLKIH